MTLSQRSRSGASPRPPSLVSTPFGDRFRPGPGSPRLFQLGPGRWRARVPQTRGGTSLDVYICDDPSACLVARTRGRLWDVLVEGELTGPAALNLGDCLVGAVAAGVRRLVLRLGRREAVAPEVADLFACFGRHLARGNSSCRVRLIGTGPGCDVLRLALLRQGVSPADRSRSQIRPTARTRPCSGS